MIMNQRIADVINNTIEPNGSYKFLDDVIYDNCQSKYPEIIISEDSFDDIFKVLEEGNDLPDL